MDLIELKNQLFLHKDDKRAIQMKGYMKDKFDFFGIPSPMRKSISKEYIKVQKQKPYTELLSLALELWQLPEREFQYIALDILIKNKKKIEIDHDRHLKSLILQKSWWDTVDFISSHLLGAYFKKHLSQRDRIADEWTQAKNTWLDRSLILYQLHYKSDTDFDFLKAIVLDHAASSEFFLKKAQGWALRQYSKVNPTEVRQFIDEYSSLLSKLTIKEGTKYL